MLCINTINCCEIILLPKTISNSKAFYLTLEKESGRVELSLEESDSSFSLQVFRNLKIGIFFFIKNTLRGNTKLHTKKKKKYIYTCTNLH